jgi:hypothetical protein
MSTRPGPNWRHYRDFDGSLQKFDFTAEIRVDGFWESRPDDDPPNEDMIRVAWLVYVLWGVMDSGYRRIPPRQAKAWLEARQAFARGKSYERLYAKMPEDLLGDLSEDEDPPGAAGGRRDPGEWRTLDDLTSAAWKLLQAMRDRDATDSGKAVGREEIAAKAGVGHANSQHIEAIFKGLKRLGLVLSRRNAGTWLTAAGIEAISRRGPT